MRVPERMYFTRIVATASAIDEAVWPVDVLVLRTAKDEVLVAAVVRADEVSDPHAIIAPETALCAHWSDRASAMAFLERECDWELPTARPAFAQGAVAGLPLKVWFTEERVLFVVPAPFAEDFAERWS